jgi:hypothetical protein
LKDAELKNERVRAQAQQEGFGTVGKQRSNAHIASLGPAFFLDDDGDVFARKARLLALGAAGIIYSSHSFGFVKEGAAETSKGGRLVVVLNRPWAPGEHKWIWEALNHLLGDGFDECGKSISQCYGQHARRSADTLSRRERIDGAALNADALVALGKSLRPEYGGTWDQNSRSKFKRSLAEEIERTKLMGAVLPPDDYTNWMSSAGAFKRAFPNDEEAAWACFNVLSGYSFEDKNQTTEAERRKKFDEVSAEYEGEAVAVTIDMLHGRTRRCAEKRLGHLYPRLGPPPDAPKGSPKPLSPGRVTA